APGQQPSPARIGLYQVADLALTWSLVAFRQRELALLAMRPVLRRLSYSAGIVVSILTLTFPVILPLPTFQQRLIAYMLVFWLHWVVTAAALKRWTALAALAPFGLFGTSEWAFGPLLGAAARLGFALPYLGNRTRRLVQVLVLVTAVAGCANRIGAGIA